MAIRKTAAELLPLTRELADKVSKMARFMGERELKESRLKLHQDRVRNGTFVSPTWSIVTVMGEIKEYRADGQHSSNALMQLPQDEFPRGHKVTINRFEIDSVEQDGAILFDMFDHPRSARTNTDVMGFYSAAFENIESFHPGFLVKAARGIDYSTNDRIKKGEKTLVRYDARAYGLYWQNEVNREFAVWLHQFVNDKHAWMLSKTGLVAEIYDDWRTMPDVATEFWEYVFKENHKDPEHETRELSTKLKEWTTRPRIKQHRFRNEAARIFRRYRRLVEAERGKAA